MRKLFALACATLMGATVLTGCSSSGTANPSDNNTPVESPETNEGAEDNKAVDLPDDLIVYFVPSREPEEIITATEPLKGMLEAELSDAGYDMNVEIHVGTSYEAVGEALSAGTAHVGFIPGGTYVLYDDGAEVILTATRDGLSHDSDNPTDWNTAPTEASEEQVTYYRALAIAGPSEVGQALTEKVENGEELTVEDLQSAKWGVMGSSSSAGYLYPYLWLQENYSLGITDLDNVIQNDSYGSAMTRLASEQLDVVFAYADVRRDYVDRWTEDYGRSASIWEETNVIGVTDGIYNDTISVSRNADFIDDAFKTALQNAFINIASTEEGLEVISIYSHNGYEIGVDANYDGERDAQALIRELSN